MSDVLIAGGGFAGGLLACRLSQLRPELTLRLVEAESHLGGHHTAAFHSDELTPAQREWVRPLVAHAWEGYEVRFPSFARTVSGGYQVVTAAHFHKQAAARLRGRLVLGVAVLELGPGTALLEDDDELLAGCVIDARGLPRPSGLPVGWRASLAHELELTRNHRLEQPILIDATVGQEGGLRFVSALPLGRRRLRLEDVRYLGDAELPRLPMRRAIEAYADELGLSVKGLRREEEAVLPIPLGGRVEQLPLMAPAGVAAFGARAGLFHPTTGERLAFAVHAADALAERRALDGGSVAAWSARYAREVWQRGEFARFFNRLMLTAAEPGQGWRVLARLYSMPDAVVTRFHAGRSTRLDKIRLLSGRPPVSLRRAARCFSEPPPTAVNGQ
ncbi:MAG: lycopene beta-cyclase CrtY [Vicinamibacteria bacterium]